MKKQSLHIRTFEHIVLNSSESPRLTPLLASGQPWQDLDKFLLHLDVTVRARTGLNLKQTKAKALDVSCDVTNKRMIIKRTLFYVTVSSRRS